MRRAEGWGGREGEGAFTGPRPGAASPGAHTRFPAPALPLPLLSVHLLASTVQLMQGSQHAKHKKDGTERWGRGWLKGRGSRMGTGPGIAPRRDGRSRQREERGRAPGGRARASPPGQAPQRMGVGGWRGHTAHRWGGGWGGRLNSKLNRRKGGKTKQNKIHKCH